MVLIDSYCNEFDYNDFDKSSFEVVRVYLLLRQQVRKVCKVAHLLVFAARDVEQNLRTEIAYVISGGNLHPRKTNLAKHKSLNCRLVTLLF